MRIYHFLSQEYALDDLKRQRLKVSRFADLNDPFELLGQDLSNKAVRLKFGKWKNEISDQYGVLCFSKTWRYPLLWSHYADKHRGICLGFDVPQPLLKKVKYRWERLLSDTEDDLKKERPNPRLAEALFCTKFADWKYEREIRVLLRLKDAVKEGDYYYNRFSENLDLKEVIVGPRCKVEKAKIEASIRNYSGGVTITKARIAFKTFRV